MLLSGIFPPITTPFYPDGEVYYKKLESNVERYSRTPVAGIVVLGSTGEAILLSDQERRDMLKAALAAAAPHKVMIAGTGIESAHETLRLTEYAAQLGYDAAMVRTPHYYKRQMLPANLLAFYRTVADRSALPIIIYNFPQATGYDIPAEVVIELASHPNIVAIKESSGNLDKVKNMVEGTRNINIKRQATVTETFDAVTPRMLKAAAAESEKQSRELVSVTSLAGTAESMEQRAPSPVPADSTTKPSSSAVTVVGKLKTRQKEVGFQVMVGAAHQLEPSLGLGAVGAILALSLPCAHRVLRNLCRAQRRRQCARPRKTRARETRCPARSRRPRRPRREVRHGPERLLWRPVAAAIPAALRRAESRDREVDVGNQELRICAGTGNLGITPACDPPHKSL